MTKTKPLIGIIMGSDSDLSIMSEAAKILEKFNVAYEIRVISAHRTPDIMTRYANTARTRGLKVIIAGAGGSAHLPGMTASETNLPVIAVPIKQKNHDHEALWSNIKMPPGIPLATMPENGSKNAALLAIAILGLSDTKITALYKSFRDQQHKTVLLADQKLKKIGWAQYLKGQK